MLKDNMKWIILYAITAIFVFSSISYLSYVFDSQREEVVKRAQDNSDVLKTIAETFKTQEELRSKQFTEMERSLLQNRENILKNAKLIEELRKEIRKK